MSVLVVDDDAVIQLFVTSILEDLGLSSVIAETGERCLEILADSSQPFPSLVILDITLPGMDGLEVAARIKEQVGDRHLPIIFLTGFKEPDILSRCLSVGDDFIPKPFSVEMLTAKVTAHRRVSQLYRDLDSQYQELKRFHRQVSLEHDLVDAIFRRHIEENFIEADNLRYHTSPQSLFNGDVFIPVYGPSNNLYILIGDVTGHGLPAAVGALPVFSTFCAMARKGISIGAIAAELNKALLRVLPDNMMMAACILEMNSAADQIAVWSGGLPPAVIADEQGRRLQLIEAGHCPLAMLAEHEFSQDIQVFQVEPRSRIYLFTDGVEECRNRDGEMYGDERLYQLFDGSDPDVYQRILQELQNFSEGVEQDDDITLVELVCSPIELAENSPARPQEHLLPWSLTIHLTPAEIRRANPITQVIRLLSNAVGVDVHQDYISTILSELYNNALDHGLLGLDSSLKDSEDGFIEYYTQRKQRLESLEDGFIEIRVALDCQREGSVVTVRVRDSGPGFAATTALAGPEDAVHGRGQTIVRALCEQLHYSEDGACATATYRL